MTTYDYTSLAAAARCARLYQLQYEDRWRPREVNVPQHAGAALHAALEVLYTKRWDRAEALDALRSAWGDLRLPPNHRHGYMTLGHLEVVLQNYIDRRESHPTALEEAIGSHALTFGEKAVVFDWPHPETGEVLRLGGKLDLPTIIGGQRAIVDHKTTTQWLNDHWYYQRFALGHQLRIYAAAMEALTGESFRQGFINGIYIGQEPKSGWGRVSSVPDKLFPPEHFTPAKMAETWEWAKANAQSIAFWRQLGLWPQNEGACDDYGGCPFLEVCRAHPVRRAAVLASGFVKWTPQGVLVSGADGQEAA